MTIIDHGRPIARIVPVQRPTRLDVLRDEGRVGAPPLKIRPGEDPRAVVSDLGEHHTGDRDDHRKATQADNTLQWHAQVDDG